MIQKISQHYIYMYKLPMLSSTEILKLMHKLWKNTTTIGVIYSITLLILIVVIIVNVLYRPIEGFKSTSEFITKKGSEIYDNFYVSIYDDLVYDNIKNQWELGHIINKTSPSSASYFLDVGSGTGHHVGSLQEHGFKAAGVDISPAMVEKATSNYPDAKFQVGDITKTITFGPDSFTHITCLYFTIYYIQNKRQFFKNCMYWLVPGGQLILHLVNRNKFDPILPVGDISVGVDPQKYTDKRISSTIVKFKNYDYKADFSLKDDIGHFDEIFKNKSTGDVRKNELELYMPSQEKILAMARDAGLILVSHTSMSPCQCNNQYIYVLQKPN